MSLASVQWKYYRMMHISFQFHVQRCYIAVLKPAVVGVCVPWKLENTVDQEYPVLRVGC